MEEVIINVEGKKVTVKKSVLCWYSAYFQAMFSENFRERDQQEITLNGIDAKSLKFILDFMKHERIDDILDRCEHSLDHAGDLAEAANMLQIAQISEIVKSSLEHRSITPDNCFEIMAIAKNANYTKLLQNSAYFALTSFYYMKPELIPSVQGLVWYLSHNQLDVKNEEDVFIFGLNWMSHSKSVVNPLDLLLILGCLDMKRVTTKELFEIKFRLTDFEGTLVSQVLDCLIELSYNETISIDQVIAREITFKEKFTENVYDEVLNLVKDSSIRKIEFSLVFAVDVDPENMDCFGLFPERLNLWHRRHVKLLNFKSHQQKRRFVLYKLTNGHAKLWLESNFPPEIMDNSSDCFCSWNIAAWGQKKLVLVISHGNKTEVFNDDSLIYKTVIRVYDVLEEEWMDYDDFRKNIVYELVNRAYWLIAKLPDVKLFRTLELNLPMSCVHNNEIYVCNFTRFGAVYKYKDAADKWTKVIEFPNDVRFISNMVSHNEYIFVTDESDSKLTKHVKFKPEDERPTLASISLFAVDSGEFRSMKKCCVFENQLIFLTSGPCNKSNERKRNLYVEKYNKEGNKLDVSLILENTGLDFDSITDTCSLALTPPSVETDFSEYLQTCLRRYIDNNMSD